MRMPRLSPRDRRAALLGAAVVGAALLQALVAAPFLGALAEARDALAAERALLARETELLASAAAYPGAFEAGAERLLAAAPRLMSGEDAGAGAAALAGYLRGTARMAPTHLVRLEPAPTREAGPGVRALPVAVAGEGDLEGILTFLHLLETGPKLLHLADLRLEAAPAPRGGAAYAAAGAYPLPAPGAEGPEVLSFRFTATAFTLAAAEEGP